MVVVVVVVVGRSGGGRRRMVVVVVSMRVVVVLVGVVLVVRVVRMVVLVGVVGDRRRGGVVLACARVQLISANCGHERRVVVGRVGVVTEERRVGAGVVLVACVRQFRPVVVVVFNCSAGHESVKC